MVNISTTQANGRGPGGPGGSGGPDIPEFPPGSPFEEFFREFRDRQLAVLLGEPQAAEVGAVRH